MPMYRCVIVAFFGFCEGLVLVSYRHRPLVAATPALLDWKLKFSCYCVNLGYPYVLNAGYPYALNLMYPYVLKRG